MSRALTVVDRERVIAFELAHLGMGEHPPSGGWSEPGRWYAPGFANAPWCQMFQSWSHYLTLGFSPFPATISKGAASCHAGANWFKAHDQWASADSIPKRGWQIYFIWTPGDIEHHVGLVLGAGGPRDVDTVEGNTSNKVALHHRGGSTIAGYGVLEYAGPPIPRPTHQVTAPDGVPTIAEPENSLRVAQLQIALNFGTGTRLRIDGQFGPMTTTAVRNLQQFTHLHADGRYGPKTQWALQVACNR